MTGRFLSRGAIQTASDVDDGKWRVVIPVVYMSEVARRTITVPVGFVTDLATVPRLPILYLACANYAAEAAIVHDYLYASGLLPRRDADDVLREAAEACGVVAWRRWCLWLGVRIGGAPHYNETPC